MGKDGEETPQGHRTRWTMLNPKIADLVWLYLTMDELDQRLMLLMMKYSMELQDVLEIKRLIKCGVPCQVKK